MRSMSNKLGELSRGIEKEMWLGRRKNTKSMNIIYFNMHGWGFYEE